MIPARSLPLVLVSALSVACTGSTPPAPSPDPPGTVPLTGRILSVAATQTSSSILEYHLPQGTVTTFPSPIGVAAVNRATVAMADDGSALVAGGLGAVRAYQPATGDDPSRRGPPLPVGSAIEPTLAISPTTAVAGTCEGVWVITLASGRRWQRVGDGCWAGLGSDGSSVVYSPDGRHLVVRAGGVSTDLVDLASLRSRMGTDAAPLRLVGNPAWGMPGLAFAVRSGDQLGVFLRAESGAVVKVLQEPYANVFRVPGLAWQPGGAVLAISDDVSPSGAVLRLFDTGTGSLRALALDPVGFAGLQWSPDGAAIAVLTGASALLVVAPDGEWLLRRETDWKGLLGWTAEG